MGWTGSPSMGYKMFAIAIMRIAMTVIIVIVLMTTFISLAIMLIINKTRDVTKKYMIEKKYDKNELIVALDQGERYHTHDNDPT